MGWGVFCTAVIAFLRSQCSSLAPLECCPAAPPTIAQPWLTALANMASWAAANTQPNSAKLRAAQKAATARQAPRPMPAVQSSSALRMLLPIASSRLPPASVPSVPAGGWGGRMGGLSGQ